MPFISSHMIRFLRGCILTGLSDALPEGALRRAVNVRIDRTHGALTNRPGWTQQTSSALGAAVTWLSKLFSSTDYSYAHASTALYRLTDAWASATSIATPGTAAVSDANLVDGEGGIWKFVVNGTIAIKDDGSSALNIGIAAPTAVPSAVALAADLSTTINEMDNHAQWTGSGVSSLATDTTDFIETTGSVSFDIAASTFGSISYDPGADIDLDSLGASADDTVKNDDYIHIWVRVDAPQNLSYVQIDVDVDSTTTGVGDAFQHNYYTWSGSAIVRLAGGTNQWTKLQVRKSSFTRVGTDTSRDWANSTTFRVGFLTNSLGAVTINLDDFKLRGGVGIEGDIEYTTTYRNSSTGCRGNPYKDSDGIIQYTSKITVDRQRVTLTTSNIAEGGAAHPGDTQIDQFSVWRKGGDTFSTAVLVAHTADTTASYTDDTSDSTLALNPIALESDNDVPPSGSTRVLFGPDAQGRLYMIVNGHRLYISKPFEDGESRGENWPSLQFALVGDGSHRALGGIAKDANVYVGTESETFQIVGIGADTLLPVAIPDSHEWVGQYAVTAGGGAIYFVANDGIYEQRGLHQVKLTGAIDPFFNGVTIDGQLPMATSASARATIHLEYYPDPHSDAIVMLYPDSSSPDSAPNASLVLKRNVETGQFTECFFGASALTDLRALYVDTEANEILAGGEDGHVYLIEDESVESDAGTAISITGRTRSMDFGAPQASKKVAQVMVEGNTSSTSLTVTAYYDRNASTEALGTMATATHTAISHHPTADPTARREDLAVELTGSVSSRMTINRISAEIQPLVEPLRFWDSGVLTFADVHLVKYLEMDLYNPDAAATVAVYVNGASQDSTPVAAASYQRVVRHYLPAGIKGTNLRVTVSSTSAFELANSLAYMKPLGSTQGWKGRQLNAAAG